MHLHAGQRLANFWLPARSKRNWKLKLGAIQHFHEIRYFLLAYLSIWNQVDNTTVDNKRVDNTAK